MFGNAIAMSDDYIVIGAERGDNIEANVTASGAVYVYKIGSDDNVSRVAKLHADDAKPYNDFGFSVDVDGSYIAVGADETDREDLNITDTGTVYLYHIDENGSIVQTAQFGLENPKTKDWFGTSVSISGDRLLVGTDGIDSIEANGTVVENTGAAYLYKIDDDGNVTGLTTFTADGVQAYDYFGWSSVIKGDYILVGADGTDLFDANGTLIYRAGAAYLFKIDANDTVRQLTRITSEAPDTYGYFGETVDMSGRYFVIPEFHTTKVNLYRIDGNDSVSLAARLSENIPLPYNEFGYAASIDAERVVVGAPLDDSKAIYAGAGYLFSMEPQERIYLFSGNDINLTVEEGAQYTYRFDAATPRPPIAYSLTGGDTGVFTIVEDNLSLSTVLDFEAPVDAGGDNRYEAVVTLRDDAGNETSVDFALAVTDQGFFQLARIGGDATPEYNWLGWSVGVSGDYIVAGTYEHKAFLFKKEENGSVTRLAKLTADENVTGSYYGSSIAISGDYIVVGANAMDLNDTVKDTGAAFLFKIVSDTNVTQIAKLQSDDIEADDRFGLSVSIDGKRIVVGTYDSDEDNGTAYLFRIETNETVTQTARIRANDSEAGDKFGEAVHVKGDYVVVGVPRDRVNGVATGSAYLFKIGAGDTVTQTAKMIADDAAANAWFGGAVAMEGDYIVVGAPNDTNRTGALYLFKKSGIDTASQLVKIVPEDAVKDDSFGAAAAMDGGYILGGRFASGTLGAAYIFKLQQDESVELLEKFQPLTLKSGDWFGRAVALENGLIAVGAPRFHAVGSVYVYERDKNQPE